jgi:hypothetical protein
MVYGGPEGCPEQHRAARDWSLLDRTDEGTARSPKHRLRLAMVGRDRPRASVASALIGQTKLCRSFFKSCRYRLHFVARVGDRRLGADTKLSRPTFAGSERWILSASHENQPTFRPQMAIKTSLCLGLAAVVRFSSIRPGRRLVLARLRLAHAAHLRPLASHAHFVPHNGRTSYQGEAM